MAASYRWSKRLSWRLEYGGYLFMEFLMKLAPLSLIDRAGSLIGFLFFHLSPGYRRLAIRNLRIAFGHEKSLREIHRLARQTCQRTIANFLGTLKTTILPTEKVNRHVEFEGYPQLRETLSQGKGAILVLGHMGNWEILNRLHQFLPEGVPAGGIYQPLKNPLVDKLLLKRREQDGSKLFNKRDGFHAPATFVKNGGLLIVVADQKVGRGGTTVSFFNRLSSMSPLPALLARKAHAPVFAAGIETISPGKWKVVFDPLGSQPDTPQIISSLEKLIRRTPADYLWLHDRWRLDGLIPLSIGSRKTAATPSKTSPVRILVITPQASDLSTCDLYLAHRDPNDLPLRFEYLFLSENRFDSPLPTNIPVTQLIAPTVEQLAAQIQKLNQTQSSPIEAVLLPTPNEDLERASRLAHVPRLLSNNRGSSLEQYLAQKTRPPAGK